jgi:P27 family predicted phage terminase small subunit
MPSSRPPKIIPLAQRRARPEPGRPEAAGPPEPPKFLDAAAVKEWHRIAPALHRSGRLSALGVGPLGAYCTAWAKWMAAQEALARAGPDGLILCTKRGWPRPNPLLKAAATACAEMVRIGAMFGCTPRGRSALGN